MRQEAGAGLMSVAAARPDLRPSGRLAVAARPIGAGLLAGMAAGFVALGWGSRGAMRLAGLTSGDACTRSLLTANGARCGEFTVEGTLFLLVVGTGLGALGGLVFAVVRRWLPGRTAWQQGLTYGAGLLAAFGPAVIDADNVDFTRFGVAALNIAAFAALFVLYGLFLGLGAAWSDRWSTSRLAWILATPVVGVGLVLVLGAGVLLLENPSVPLLLTPVALAVLGVSAWRARVGGSLRPPARRLALAALTVPAVIGLLEGIREAARIL